MYIIISFELLIILWFVVSTDLTITTKKVNDLFSTMKDGLLDGVGDWLCLPYSKRSEIKRNYIAPPKGEKPT